MVTTGSLAELMMLLTSGTVLCFCRDVSNWLTIQKIKSERNGPLNKL